MLDKQYYRPDLLLINQRCLNTLKISRKIRKFEKNRTKKGASRSARYFKLNSHQTYSVNLTSNNKPILQLERQTHISLNFDLACHKRLHRLEFAVTEG